MLLKRLLNLPMAVRCRKQLKEKGIPEMYRTLYNDQLDEFVMPETYSAEKTSLPDNVFRQDELMPYYSIKQSYLHSKMVKMARAVTAIDGFVGHLRKKLEELGLADNTILVYASDHGLLLGEHGLGGKTFLYDEALRIPMIFYSPYFPDRVRGRKVDELVVGQDLPATILELCGEPVPETYQGRSMVPLIAGQKVDWRQDVFCENLFTDQGYPRMEAVRSKDWKYIRYFSKEKDRKKYLPDASIEGEHPIYEELFNLKQDPLEQHNLAADSQYAEQLNTLRARCALLVSELSK